MSISDSLVPTPASGVNRRGLLRCAGGIAAAGALSALPLATAAARFSPEFLEYRRLWGHYVDVCELPEPPFGSAEAAVIEELVDRACDASHAARRVIMCRRVRSPQDLVELAHVVRDQLWQEVNGSWEKHSVSDELEEALQLAVFAVLIEGGANV